MKVDEILRLMEGMAKSRVALLELGDLKLALAPPERTGLASAANNIGPALQAAQANQMQAQVPPQAFNVESAQRAVAEAQAKAKQLAEQRLTLAREKTARARQKAAGGIGGTTAGLVEDIYKASKEPARTKPNDA